MLPKAKREWNQIYAYFPNKGGERMAKQFGARNLMFLCA